MWCIIISRRFCIKKRILPGLDLKREVMENCTALAKKYGYTGLEFLCMDVKDYKPEKQVDMVITLHACDVATDYALAFAVKCGAKYIFSVPCCQKEANGMIHTEKFAIFTDYGLIKERFFGACDRRIARQAFGKKRLCSGCSGICGF